MSSTSETQSNPTSTGLSCDQLPGKCTELTVPAETPVPAVDSDLIFMLMIAIIALNQFLIRSKLWLTIPALFWVIQACNIGLGSWVLVYGLPGFIGDLAVINWLVGPLFLYHAVQNNLHFQRAQRELRRAEDNHGSVTE